MMLIGFKDKAGGFYQIEAGHAEDIPSWAEGMTRLTEEERIAELRAVPPEPLEKIGRIEMQNPITHRAMREFFIAFGELYPASKNTLLYERCKATDDAIKVERAKL